MIEGIESRSILQPYINNGRVDYVKLQGDQKVKELINYVQTTTIDKMGKQEQFAFWLNAYNIITLKAVCEELEKNPHWKGVTSLWQKFKFFIWNKHEIASRKMSLYHLENKILRKEFNDPRLHFAINCASTSCPYIPGKLFYTADLDQYLEELTDNFINEQGGVRFDQNTVYLSKIFKMYTDDFGGKENLIPYINKYWRGEKIPSNVTITYQDYDWSLNKQ